MKNKILFVIWALCFGLMFLFGANAFNEIGEISIVNIILFFICAFWIILFQIINEKQLNKIVNKLLENETN